MDVRRESDSKGNQSSSNKLLQDEEYLSSVESGDTKKAEEMVKEVSNKRDDILFSLKVQKHDPFYSNAAKAVEAIKQEKATPEQWLAMITKNGGLKTGEDKWMGLSDWLKQRAIAAMSGPSMKTMTKQEVMDFIAKNAIKVEEVKYGKKWGAKVGELELDLLNESDRKMWS